MKPPPPPLWRTAVHETGHFVIVMKCGLGERVRLLTIKPDTLPGGVRRHGHLARDRSPIERMMLAEQKGTDPRSILAPHADKERVMGVYQQSRTMLAMHLVLAAIAGAAADTELAGGDETMSKGDYEQAAAAAKLLVSPEQVPAFLKNQMHQLRAIFRGELRAPVLAVAERLMTRRSIAGDDLQALWAEVNPAVMEPA